MENLMKTEDREMRTVKAKIDSKKVLEYRKRIADESYLEDAISKIATDLSHYLTK